MQMPSRVSLVLLFVAAAAAGGCSAGGETTAQARAAGPGGRGSEGTVPVTVATVVEQAVPLNLTAIGSAEAYSTVAIRSQITGELTSVRFKEGDDVAKGQVLFTLDRRPLEGALQQAEANLQRDLAQAANAKAQAQRYTDLASRGIATAEQVDTSRTAAQALDATVGADRAAVENAKVQLQYATISAPISGRTGALMVNEGNLVRANDTTPLVVINQVSPIYVSFAIPEGQLPALKRYRAEGPLEVEAVPPTDSGPPSTGRVSFIDNNVDATTGTIKLKATFQNQDHRLWPGQFVNVVLTLRTDAHAVVVPSAAIQNGPQGQYVFVVKPDQTVELRPVQVARLHDDDTLIASGLKAGEVVVTDGQIRLVAGSRVSIKTGGKVTS